MKIMRGSGGWRLAQQLPLLLLLVGYLLDSTASGSPVSVQPAAVLAAAGTAQQQLLKSTPSSSSSSSTQCADKAAGQLPGDPDPAGDALIAWVQKWGGEANVVVRRDVPGSGRGTFAPRAFKKGDVLASIPVEMTYALDSGDESLAVSATYMLADMAEEDSPWAPYFNSLPSPADVWSTVHVPKAYFPIIQDRWVEEAIVLMQDNVEGLWESFADKYTKVLGPEVGAHNITHAMGLLLTRLFRFDKADVLLPIVDMANHENTCLHSHVPEPCEPKAGYQQWKAGKTPPPLSSAAGSGLYGQPSSSSSSSSSGEGQEEEQPVLSGQCIVWRAESDVAAGQEVCNSYKTLMQDRALLQYGFLQSGAPALELNMFDRHDQVQDLDHVWTDPPGSQALYGPRRFEGTPAQVKTEIERLSARLKMLHGGEAAVAAVKPDPAADPTGERLSAMLEWRRQRKAAISAEISRLERQLARLEAAQGLWGTAAGADGETSKNRGDLEGVGQSSSGKGSQEGAEGLRAVSHELVQWLEGNGAQVQVELKSLEPQATQQSCGSSSSSDDSSQGTCSTAATAAAAAPPAAGVFTRTAVKAGDTLAVIPVSLGYSVRGGEEKLESAVRLMTDIQAALNTSSSTTGGSSSTTGGSTSKDSSTSTGTGGGSTSRLLAPPFMRSLPPLGTVRSLYNFPAEYLPVIQQGRVEHHIRRTQQALWTEFEAHRPEIEARDNSTAYLELQHAASLISASPLLPIPSPLKGQQEQQQQGEEEGDFLLVPLLTNARHNASCPHHYFTGTCPSSSSSSSSDLCVFWVAGSDLPAGSEVCVTFGHLRSDQALLMYGLPLEPADSSSSSSRAEMWLAGMDHISSTDDEPLAPIAAEPFTHWTAGSRDEALSEAVFLLELHQNRTQNATHIAKISTLQPAVPWDPSGAFLGQLRHWRQQRLSAIDWELSRLLTEWGISRQEVEELLLQQQQQEQQEDANGVGVLGVGGSAGQHVGVVDSRFSSNSSDPWQRMLDWMRHNGAVVNVNVTHAGPQFGRVVVTTAPAKRGELLAAIPLDLVWNVVTSGGNGTMQLAAANFWAEIDDPTSPLRPYLDALPSQDELLCPLVHLPPDYLPLLASEKAEAFVEAYQEQITEFWEAHGQDMAGKVPSVTLERFKHARALLATRLFGLAGGASMIPLLDLANHAPECPNIHEEAPCPNEPERSCIVWTAGAFLPRGAEVCNSYKWMSNDRSMLQYGFLQAGPIANALHSLDHAATNSTNIFQVFDKLKHGPELFNGTAAEIKAEIARLTAALANLTATDATAAAAAAVPTDRDGRQLSLLRTWRQQRQAALQKELARLEQLLLSESATAAAGGGEKEEEGKATVEAKLIQWIEDRGGQVNGLTVGAPDADCNPAADKQQQQQQCSASRSSSSSSSRPGVFATKSIKAGQLLAVVPLELALPVNTDNLLLDGPVLHSELRDSRSSRAPFYVTLAAHASGGMSFYDIPIEYSPVIQHKPTEDVLAKSNSTLIDFLEDNPELLSGRNMTLADLKHTFTLLATRLVLFRPEGGHLVPLLDLANHQNGCQHSLTMAACNKLPGISSSGSSSGSSSVLNTTRLCVVWRAGADVTPGQEVCKSFGWLLPDRALLQYGFLPQELQQQQQQLVPLFGMDRHDFRQQARGQLPWRYRLDSTTEPEPFFTTGDSKDLHLEIVRLELLTDSLAAGDAAADAVTPVSDDPDGKMLSQLRHLRRFRKAGVAQELARLQALQQKELAAQQKDEL